MKRFIKIKDLPKDLDLVGCKVKGKYIVSGWNKGFWCKSKLKDIRLVPIFFDKYEDIKDWIIDINPDKRGVGLCR